MGHDDAVVPMLFFRVKGGCVPSLAKVLGMATKRVQTQKIEMESM